MAARLRKYLLIVTVGAVFAATGGCGLLERDVQVVQKAPQFDSPRVTDLRVQDGLRILLDDGYDVVVIGRGRIVLQELGDKGSVLKIKGDTGKQKRYCSPSLGRCVPIPRGHGPRSGHS